MSDIDRLSKIFQRRLKYSDEQMEQFLAKPANQRVLEASFELAKKTVRVEVTEARGCFCGHKVGQEWRYDGSGALITESAPARLCVHLGAPMAPIVQAVQELVFAGADPSQLKFDHFGCLDVGLECGGWGHVTCKVTVEDA